MQNPIAEGNFKWIFAGYWNGVNSNNGQRSCVCYRNPAENGV